jgi:hypothetical protein
VEFGFQYNIVWKFLKFGFRFMVKPICFFHVIATTQCSKRMTNEKLIRKDKEGRRSGVIWHYTRDVHNADHAFFLTKYRCTVPVDHTRIRLRAEYVLEDFINKNRDS